MEKYVCPPWFECRCILGKPVSKSTMLAHRRVANAKRAELGLSLFPWGPKVDPGTDFYIFDCMDTLLDHEPSIEVLVQPTTFLRTSNDETASVTPQRGTRLGNSSGVHDRESMRSHIPNFVDNETNVNDLPTSQCNQVEAAHLTSVQDGQRCSDDHLAAGELSGYGQTVNSDSSMPSASRSNSSEEIEDESAGIDSINDDGDEKFLVPGLVESAPAQVSDVNDNVGSGSARIPDLLPWLMRNEKWVNLAFKHSLNETVMDEILNLLDAPCKQWKTVVSNICKATELGDVVQRYSVCPGHMAFVPHPETGIVPDRCSECDSPAPNTQRSENVFEYLPIIPRLRKIIASPVGCESLYSCRRSRQAHHEVVADYFDGACFKALCEKYGGEESLADDVFVLASTDGFAPFKNRKYDMWSVAAVTFNYPPHQRYLPQNVIPLTYIPGPSQPKNLQSFLLPLVNELRTASEGVLMRFPDGSTRSVRIHLICFTGDQPAICKVSGLVGPNGKTPCRDCNVQGYYSNHYYFPSKIKTSPTQTRLLFNPRDLPVRTVAENLTSIQEIESKTGRERKILQTNCGISKNSVLFFVPSMLPYVSFPHDIMHTFYNVQVELLRIILGPYEDEFSVEKNQVEVLDAELCQWKWGISSQIGPQPSILSRYKDWKAAEHKTFSISHSVVIFDGVLPSLFLKGLKMFSDLVDLCTRGELTNQDADHIEELAIKFFEHYERCYFRYREDRVDFCKSTFHILLHLSDCVRNFGPLIGISQYWVEGHIGWIGGRNNSKNKPAQSMFKNGVFSESLKSFYGRSAYQKSNDVEDIMDRGCFAFMGKPRLMNLCSFPDRGRQIKSQIADYLCRKYEMSESQAKEIISDLTAVQFFPRVKFLSGSETRTAAVYLGLGERHARKTQHRPSCYIAVEMESLGSSSMDVWYGRLLRLIRFDLSYAENEVWGIQHDVAIVDWARALFRGSQDQIFTNGRMSSAFSGPTVEDVTIVRRLIAIVEHSVPRPVARRTESRTRRMQVRCYFLDDAVRVDFLLSATNHSSDGINRVLKGFQR